MLWRSRMPAATRTLRFRLMVWNAMVVILTALTTLVIVREGVRLSLLGEMDLLLEEDLKEIHLAALDSRSFDLNDIQPTLDRKAEGHSQHHWFVQLVDGSENVVWSSLNTPDLPRIDSMSNRRLPFTHHGFRIVEASFDDPKHQRVTIRVGSSLELLQRDMSRIDRLVVMGVAVVLLIAPLGGYFLAGRATRPLNAIIETTARLRPSELNERLQIRKTGDELDRLSATINSLLDRIATYLNQRRDFIANAAHELRSPLAAIRSSVEVAMNSKRSPQEYEELLLELIDECQMLETLVNQLLLLAESDANSLKTQDERVNLSQVVHSCAEMFRGVAESREIALVEETEPSIVVDGNRTYLRQVLNNLLDNALKFTPAGGRVTLRMHQDSLTGLVVLDVHDTGCGIPEADQPHVFERFFRGDKSRQREGQQRGTGLGLSICRAILEAHRGQISVHSAPRSGTMFRVTLPGAWTDSHVETREASQAHLQPG